nr:asparagine synthase-related protein [Halochromatium roseum]
MEATWPEDSDPVTAAARFEWREKMVNDLLWQEDRVSMARGLEVRVPFVDQPLAGVVGQWGRQALMPDGQLKGLLREVLQPVLPVLILSRPKSGFQVNAPAFFHQQLKPLAKVWLSDARLRETGLFNPVFVQRVLAYRPGKATRWHYFMLYFMLMSQLWLDEFERA